MDARASRSRAPRRPCVASGGGQPLVKMAELSKRSGVPGPTIKHYIREGLLPGPEVRTSRNMAYYDARLASRIRVIKELQAERFLPLRVIAELLEDAPSDRLRPERAAARPSEPAVAAPPEPDRPRRRRSEVMQAFGVSRAELDRLERAGVLELRGEGEAAGYGGADLELLAILAELRRLGLGDVFPITVVEPYMVAVRALVDFELDVLRRRALAAPLPAPLSDVARHAVVLGERLIVGLRAKVLPAMIEQLAAAR